MEQRIRELVDKLNEYSKAYYVLDAPKISDKEYDELYDELLRLRSSRASYYRTLPPSA